jgi:hypothetical protein
MKIKSSLFLVVLLMSTLSVYGQASTSNPTPAVPQTTPVPPAPQAQATTPTPESNVDTLRVTIRLMKQQAKIHSIIAKDQLRLSIDQTKLQIFQREAQIKLADAKK